MFLVLYINIWIWACNNSQVTWTRFSIFKVLWISCICKDNPIRHCNNCSCCSVTTDLPSLQNSLPNFLARESPWRSLTKDFISFLLPESLMCEQRSAHSWNNVVVQGYGRYLLHQRMCEPVEEFPGQLMKSEHERCKLAVRDQRVNYLIHRSGIYHLHTSWRNQNPMVLEFCILTCFVDLFSKFYLRNPWKERDFLRWLLTRSRELARSSTTSLTKKAATNRWRDSQLIC